MRSHDIRTAVSAYIHDRLARETENQWGAASHIARATNTTSAHVANVKNGKAAAGPDFSAALARYWGMEEEELERTAVAWFQEFGARRPLAPPAVVRWADLDSRYPNLAEAIAILRREGMIDSTLLDEVERTKLRSDRDLPVTTWWRMIEVEADLRRRSLLSAVRETRDAGPQPHGPNAPADAAPEAGEGSGRRRARNARKH